MRLSIPYIIYSLYATFLILNTMSNLTLPSNKYNNSIWSPLLIAVSISEWKGNTNICYITEKLLSKNSWLYINNILMLLSTAIWSGYQNCESTGDWSKCETFKKAIFYEMHLPKSNEQDLTLHLCVHVYALVYQRVCVKSHSWLGYLCARWVQIFC